jgi:hypothetical protein
MLSFALVRIGEIQNLMMMLLQSKLDALLFLNNNNAEANRDQKYRPFKSFVRLKIVDALRLLNSYIVFFNSFLSSLLKLFFPIKILYSFCKKIAQVLYFIYFTTPFSLFASLWTSVWGYLLNVLESYCRKSRTARLGLLHSTELIKIGSHYLLIILTYHLFFLSLFPVNKMWTKALKATVFDLLTFFVQAAIEVR